MLSAWCVVGAPGRSECGNLGGGYKMVQHVRMHPFGQFIQNKPPSTNMFIPLMYSFKHQSVGKPPPSL